MRALITGVGGFVGPYLARSFIQSGVECYGTVHADSDSLGTLSQSAVARIDVRDAFALRDFVTSVAPDVVVHLAAISDIDSSLRHPSDAFAVNVGGTANLLEAVRTLRQHVRVLLVSSGAVYGDSDSGPTGFSESDTPRPASTYAMTKLMSEQVARCYFRDHHLDVVIARPFNHTGPGQSDSFVCSSFARQVAESMGRSGAVVIRTGALHPQRDFTDVGDVVAAYRAILEKGRSGEVYNVCSGRLVSISEILTFLGHAAGCDVRGEVDPTKIRAGEIARLGGDSSKLRNELQWAPRIELSETLSELLEFWRWKARVAA